MTIDAMRDDLHNKIEQAFVDAYRDHPGDVETVNKEVASWVKRVCHDEVWERWGHRFMGFWWRQLCGDERRLDFAEDEGFPSAADARLQPSRPGRSKVNAEALNRPEAIFRLRFQVRGVGVVDLGDVTLEHGKAISAQYKKLETGMARRARFFDALVKALARTKAKTVREVYRKDVGKLIDLWNRTTKDDGE